MIGRPDGPLSPEAKVGTRRDISTLGFTARDWLCVAGLVGSVLTVLIARGPFSLPPAEDAAMLLRYSDNLAHGHGFVWNIGERPVDGATDFLFMLAVAMVRSFGANLIEASHLVGIAAHLATIPLVYWAIRTLGRAPRPAALACATYVAFGLGLRYVDAGFGTTLFALCVALVATTWVFIERRPQSASARWTFGICCLLMGLARPEGAALALLALLSVFVLVRDKYHKPILLVFALTFGLFGSIYFVWHWLHFGYPLPNPVYVRAAVPGGHLTSFRDSLRNSIFLLSPLAPFAILQFARGSPRSTVALLLPIVGFVSLWFALSHSMNFGMRYQYALVPLVFITWAPALQSTCSDLTVGRRASLLLSSSAIAIFALVFMHRSLRTWTDSDQRRAIGVALSLFPHDYTMATTEAGQLPLYSQWRALDTRGLNDSWIAHHGLSQEYLAGNHPALIVIANDPSGSAQYLEETRCLHSFVASQHYAAAAVFDSFEFYVAPWLPDAALLTRTIDAAAGGGHARGE